MASRWPEHALAASSRDHLRISGIAEHIACCMAAPRGTNPDCVMSSWTRPRTRATVACVATPAWRCLVDTPDRRSNRREVSRPLRTAMMQPAWIGIWCSSMAFTEGGSPYQAGQPDRACMAGPERIVRTLPARSRTMPRNRPPRTGVSRKSLGVWPISQYSKAGSAEQCATALHCTLTILGQGYRSTVYRQFHDARPDEQH